VSPLIGISAELAPVTRYWGTDVHHVVDADYVRAVAAAGGLPVLLPVGDADLAPSLLDRLDGLVLTGGDDVDPACYGQVRVDAGTGGEPDPARDRFELALARAAIARDLPTLAICRGLQIVNVACGGTLIQHLADHPQSPPPDGGDQDVADRDRALAHPVRLVAGSRLARNHGALTAVNSFHHQAVDRPGTGVSVVATSGDGVVEAIELDGAPRLVAVQWHPELLPDRPEHQALFGRLIRLAGERP